MDLNPGSYRNKKKIIVIFFSSWVPVRRYFPDAALNEVNVLLKNIFLVFDLASIWDT